MKKTAVIVIMAAAFIMPAIIPKQSDAMPGFARKYRISCQVCHAPFPRLKEYGDEFAGNGFRLPEGENERRYYTDGGDDLMMLQRDFPLGARFDLYVSHEPDRDPSNTDLKTPWLAKIISGGPIYKNISYYFYFYMSEHGEVAGIEDALLYFQDLGGTGVNVTAGQFAVSDPIFKNELRLTFEPYQLLKIHPTLSDTDLMYDRGVVVDYSFDFGLDIVGEVINGNGLEEAENDSYDKDDYKNYMLRMSQSVGPVRFGGFYYLGMEDGLSVGAAATADPEVNHIDYYGGDMTITFEKDTFEINALYLVRKDSNPHFLADDDETMGQGVMVEMLIQPEGDQGRWAFTGLYNDFDSDYEEVIDGTTVDALDYQTGTFQVSYLMSRNVRAIAEYTYIIRDYSKGEDYHDRSRYMAGVVAGF